MIIENVWPNRTVSETKPLLEPYSWVSGGQNALTLLGGAPERDRRRSTHCIAQGGMFLIQPLFDLLDAANKSDHNHQADMVIASQNLFCMVP